MMKNVPLALLIWALAIIGNVVGWVLIGGNANERYPLWVFVTCLTACSAAAWITGRNLKFVAVGFIIGVAIASLLVFS